MCVMTHLRLSSVNEVLIYICVCHDSFMCVCNDSFTCASWLIYDFHLWMRFSFIYVCVMTHLCVCVMTHLHVCHDSFTTLICKWGSHLYMCVSWLVYVCVQWLIYMCVMTHLRLSSVNGLLICFMCCARSCRAFAHLIVFVDCWILINKR